MRPLIIAAWLLLFFLPRLHALSADEAIRLSRAGVTDDILLTQIEADGSAGTIPPAEVERLRRANVSEAVIRALVGEVPASDEPREESAASSPPRAEAPADDRPPALAPGQAWIVVANEERMAVTVAIDSGARVVEFAEGKGAGSLAPGKALQAALPSGVWTAVWRGAGRHYRVSVRPGERTDLILLTIDAADAAGTRLRVLRNGRDFGSSVLRLTPREPVVVERPPRTIVVRPGATVVVPPQTVIVQPQPVYAPAPVYYDCQTGYPVPAAGYAPVPYPYGTYSPSLIDYHGVYRPTYWDARGCR